MPDELPDRVRTEHGRGVREHEDPVPGPLDRAIERGGLAGARREQEGLDGRVVDGRQDVVGAIGRTVGDEDHLEPVARIVEVRDVGDLILQTRLLVVRGHDQRHRRQLGVAERPAPAVAPGREEAEVGARLGERVDDEEQARIEDVRVAHERETPPEDRVSQHASALRPRAPGWLGTRICGADGRAFLPSRR